MAFWRSRAMLSSLISRPFSASVAAWRAIAASWAAKLDFESLLELGHQLVEIGHGVRGKRGHSLKSISHQVLEADDVKPSPPAPVWQIIPFGRVRASAIPAFSVGRGVKM